MYELTVDLAANGASGSGEEPPGMRKENYYRSVEEWNEEGRIHGIFYNRRIRFL